MTNAILVAAILSLVMLETEQNCLIESEFNQKFQAIIPKGGFNSLFVEENPVFDRDSRTVYYPPSWFGKDIRKIVWEGSNATVKRITKSNNEYELKLQKQEVKFLDELKNENVTPDYYTCLETDKHLFIIQQDIGESMDTESMKIAFQKLRPQEKVAAILTIGSLIEKIHSKRIIHSDIKPSNIVSLDKSMKEFRLIDFSSANNISLSARGGTSCYKPPMVLINKIGTTGSGSFQDVYGFAITIAVLEGSFQELFNNLKDKCDNPEDQDDFNYKLGKNFIEIIRKSEIAALYPALKKFIPPIGSKFSSIKGFLKEISTEAKKIKDEVATEEHSDSNDEEDHDEEEQDAPKMSNSHELKNLEGLSKESTAKPKLLTNNRGLTNTQNLATSYRNHRLLSDNGTKEYI